MKSIKLAIVAAAMAATAGAAMAADAVVPYVKSTSNQVVVSGTGLCVRTGFWTPALAANTKEAEQCDADLVKKPAAKPTKKKKPAKVTLNADALFDFGSAAISAQGAQSLDALVGKLAGVNVDVVLVTGYTDSIGSEAFNMALSEKRAEAVKAYLVGAGVAEKVVQPLGLGPDNPVVECKKGPKAEMIKCMAPNRRAELEVFGSRAAK